MSFRAKKLNKNMNKLGGEKKRGLITYSQVSAEPKT